MRRYTDSDVTVTLSREGLRRAYRDNALLASLERVRAACPR
jgi:hypothetical protein